MFKKTRKNTFLFPGSVRKEQLLIKRARAVFEHVFGGILYIAMSPVIMFCMFFSMAWRRYLSRYYSLQVMRFRDLVRTLIIFSKVITLLLLQFTFSKQELEFSKQEFVFSKQALLFSKQELVFFEARIVVFESRHGKHSKT